MTEYHRFISYLYEYLDQKKSRNCGYVRVEFRNGLCRLDIHMKLPAYPYIPSFEAFVWSVSDGHFLQISLGKCTYRHGAVYGNFLLHEKQLSVSLTTLSGIFVQVDSGQLFATSWKEEPFNPEIVNALKPADTLERFDTSKASDILEGFDASKASDTPEVVNITEVHALASGEDTPDPAWIHIQKHYPQVYPFFDDDIHQCVQLTLADLPHLQELGFSIGTNPFWLYSFQYFQHFLLGKKESEPTLGYILGIPGIYSEKEQTVASTFGFPHFKAAKAPASISGSFGYWYRYL